MVNIIAEISKYMMIVLMAAYTFSCFSIFAQSYEEDEKRVYILQNVLMFLMQFLAYAVMYLKTGEQKLLLFFAVQVVLLVAVILLYSILYPNVSRLIVNNMCMLLSVGLIMITRLSYESAVKQFIFIALGTAIGGIGIQPSEFVKILFVFYVAASLKNSTEFKNVVITTAVAAAHVLILVVSTDLGAALILFVVYLVMLYVATKQPLYAAAGIGAGSLAAVAGYHLFAHIKIRVSAWKDPFASYNEGGYQVAQSLFAIGTGSWFGMGLCQGSPDLIPVAESDFIFSAIAEELGVIFALCVILICVSCYVMFLNIAMELRNRFYKLVALGLGTCYIFQVFLTIGGVTKFIPSTGVTLPLVSYGGSSILSSMIMIGIIQGLYILREDEEEELEWKREMAARKRRAKAAREKRERSGNGGRNSEDYEGQRQNPGRRTGGGQKRNGAGQDEPGRERAIKDEQRGSRNKKPTKEKSKFEEVPKQRIR